MRQISYLNHIWNVFVWRQICFFAQCQRSRALARLPNLPAQNHHCMTEKNGKKFRLKQTFSCPVSIADGDAHVYKNINSPMRNNSISFVARRQQLVTNFRAAILEIIALKMPTKFPRWCDSCNSSCKLVTQSSTLWTFVAYSAPPPLR